MKNPTALALNVMLNVKEFSPGDQNGKLQIGVPVFKWILVVCFKNPHPHTLGHIMDTRTKK